MTRPSLSTLAAATAFAVVVGVAPAAHAQVSFDGATSGSFNGGGPAYQGLSFTGLNFGPAMLNIGETWSGSFGTMTHDGTRYNWGPNNDVFALSVNFYSPAAGGEVFTASMAGNVNHGNSNMPNIHFNGPFQITAGNAIFEVTVDDITGRASSPADVRGTITLLQSSSTTVPEPISMALLGTGLAGVAAARRRRKGNEAV